MVWGALVLMPLATVAQTPPSVTTEETPYIPTPQIVVDKMLEIAAVRTTDFVMDLGSGDGRIVITAAAKCGARGLGVDYDGYHQGEPSECGEGWRRPPCPVSSERHQRGRLLSATVLTMYLLPEFNLALRPKILAQLRPGARVVSHDWGMGDWEADTKVEVPAPEKIVGVNKSSTIYLWIVPARVAGRWHSRVALEGRVTPLDLDVKQRFQQIEGTATIDGVKLNLEHARVSGQLVSFRLTHTGKQVGFEGQLKNNRIVGQVTAPDRRPGPWRAVREKSDGG